MNRVREGTLFGEEQAEATSASTPKLYCSVAVNRPLRREFSYSVPDELADSIAVGMRVAVNFSGSKEIGVVVALATECDLDPKKVRPIRQLLDQTPVVDAELLELTYWMANYYACSWGETLAAVLPGALKRETSRRKVLMIEATEGVGEVELQLLETSHSKQHRLLRSVLEAGKRVELRELTRRLNLSDAPARTLEKKGWVRLEKIEVDDDPFGESHAKRERPAKLTDEQESALKTISECLDAHEYSTQLIEGVTGSGKTEVYLRAIEHALGQERGAIVLVPEIALTPQTVSWFRSRFGEVAVMHSRLTDVQRLRMWRRVQLGEARVVVGARSAIFAPVKNLGVIVVDEEHEPSFKQSNSPRYHARDVAVMRARLAKGVCLLGSATPSLESWHNSHEGRYGRIELKKRFGDRGLPKIDVVDMRAEQAEEKGPVLFSKHLLKLLRESLTRKEQAILFLNRRGFTPTLWCPSCKERLQCQNCAVALTYHRRIHRVVCHSCCEEQVPPRECPTCTAPGLRYFGAGSERVEEVLKKLVPDARVRRMDSDTMIRREDYEETLDAFGRREIDVLVGTQMIAKGLDFPGVTVVGVMSADSSLHLPDYRASERTFQLLAQVAGRAGRGKLAGRIVVQAMSPDHPVIQHAKSHDYTSFAREEAELREELGYPPYGRLIRCVFEDPEEARAMGAASDCSDLLREDLQDHNATVLGPAQAPIALVRNRHRAHLIVKAPSGDEALARVRWRLLRYAEDHARPRIGIDVDPVDML